MVLPGGQRVIRGRLTTPSGARRQRPVLVDLPDPYHRGPVDPAAAAASSIVTKALPATPVAFDGGAKLRGAARVGLTMAASGWAAHPGHFRECAHSVHLDGGLCVLVDVMVGCGDDPIGPMSNEVIGDIMTWCLLQRLLTTDSRSPKTGR